MGKIVDIHTHLLWGVDDGSHSIEQTMEMLEQAVIEGITDLIATSHSHHPLYDVSYQTVANQVSLLQEEIRKNSLPITLYTGHEVRLFENILSCYKAKEIHTLANSKYLLLELPPDIVPYYTIHIIRDLLAEGIIPVIAHPERNKAILDRPIYLERLIREGAVAQITAGSLAGRFGRTIQNLSLDFVRANLVHTYGSDVHHLVNRPYLFYKGLEYLEKKKELDAIDLLLENNTRILENKPLFIQEPLKLKNTKWWSIMGL